MLSVRGLDAHYGLAHILAGLELTVQRGEVVVLLGRNGAGKSTTLKSIIGLVRPSSGQITFEGQGISGRSPSTIARLGLSMILPWLSTRSTVPCASSTALPASARPLAAARRMLPT